MKCRFTDRDSIDFIARKYPPISSASAIMGHDSQGFPGVFSGFGDNRLSGMPISLLVRVRLLHHRAESEPKCPQSALFDLSAKSPQRFSVSRRTVGRCCARAQNDAEWLPTMLLVGPTVNRGDYREQPI